MAKNPKPKTARELSKGTETFDARRKRLGRQGVSLAQEQLIVDNLHKKSKARGEKVSRREILRRFRLSQEFTIGKGTVNLKGGRKGKPIVSRKTGRRLRVGVTKTPRSRTPREAVLKTRPRTRLT